jgi:hypothetical protein
MPSSGTPKGKDADTDPERRSTQPGGVDPRPWGGPRGGDGRASAGLMRKPEPERVCTTNARSERGGSDSAVGGSAPRTGAVAQTSNRRRRSSGSGSRGPLLRREIRLPAALRFRCSAVPPLGSQIPPQHGQRAAPSRGLRANTGSPRYCRTTRGHRVERRGPPRRPVISRPAGRDSGMWHPRCGSTGGRTIAPSPMNISLSRRRADPENVGRPPSRFSPLHRRPEEGTGSAFTCRSLIPRGIAPRRRAPTSACC